MPQVPQSDDSPYRDTLARVKQREDLKLRQSSAAAAGTNPDQHAEVLKLSERTRFSPAFVGRNFDALQRKTKINDFEVLRFNAPKTVSWLSSHPDNMAVGQDDTGPLSAFERLLTGARVLFSGTVMRSGAGLLSFLETASKIPFPAEGVGSLEEDIDYTPLLRTGVRSPGTEFLEDRRRMTEAAIKTIRGNFEKRTGPMEQAIFGGIESVGQVLAAVPLGPAGMLGVLGASTAGSSATKATDQGLPPSAALVFGSIDGAIEVATEKIPVGLLFKQVQLAAPFLKTLVKQLAAEIPGEQVATVLQDLNAWVALPEHKDSTFRDYLEERPSAAAQTLVATIVGTLGQGGIARAAARVSGKPLEQALFEELGKTAAESKTLQRLPAKLQELVSSMTKDGPLETVYAPIDTFNTYWQSREVEPRAVARQLLGDTKAYDEAQASGSDLSIPTAIYAAKMAGTEHNTFFAKELRFAPEQMNAREQEEFDKAVEEQQESEGNSSESEGNSAATSAARVREDIAGQLLGQGFKQETVDAYAALYESAFRTMGERSGVDPFELYEPYKLRITRPIPEILRALPDISTQLDPLIDRLRAGQGPTQSEMFGISLISFLKEKGGVLDEGGDLASREADKDLKPFEKRLIQEKGLPLDKAREMAAEAGYLPAQSSVADFLDVIDKELRGTPVYSQQQHNAQAIEQGLQLEQLEGYLKSRDVDLAQATNDDVKKLLQEAAEQPEIDAKDGTVLRQTELALENRGGIQFYPPGHPRRGEGFKIQLLETADLSTFLHESGHFYLEVFGDVVDGLRGKESLTPEQQKMVEDYDKVLLPWLNVEGRAGIERDQHEQFARGFEAYLREGNAPTPELRSIFARFRAWLVNIYRSLVQLRVQLTPEVTGVMDRLLATEEEIGQAEADAGILGMIEDLSMATRLGMTREQFKLYGDQVRAASDARKQELQKTFLEEYSRYSEEWWKARRGEVRAEVAASVYEQRVYIALAFFQTGKLPDGSPLPNGIEGAKLDAGALEERYGKASRKKGEGSTVMNRLLELRVYRRENGIDPGTAAELFGYSSGDELVQALVNTRDMNQLIDAETDSRMKDQYGDMLLDGSAGELAKEAVMVHGRAEVVLEEMKALVRAQRQAEPFVKEGQRQEKEAEADRKMRGLLDFQRFVPKLSAVRAIAERRVRETRVRDLRPGTYWVAARNASKAAFEAAGAGKYAEALAAKQKELISIEMNRAATEALGQVEKIRTLMGSFDEVKKRAKIGKAGEDYLDQIDALRERYSFARRSDKQIERSKRLADWIADREAQGLPVDVPAALLNETRQTNYREASVEELYGLRDGVEHIAHLAKLKNRLLKAKDKREFDAAVADMVGSIGGNSKGPRKRTYEPRLPGDQRSRRMSTFFASHRKLHSFLREMDGFKDAGVMWERVMRPINDAANEEAVRVAQATAELQAIFDAYYKGRETALYRKDSIPEINGSLSKSGQLMAALNWGNAANRQRLMDGHGWNEGQVQAVLNRLDEGDWKFVKVVAVHLNSYWPEIEAKEKRVSGIAPEKVEATPFLNRFGELLPGWYFPIDYESRLSARAAGNQEAGFAESIKQASYTRATTRRGHTEERVKKVTEPVRLDFGVIFEHVNQVLHDLTHHEMLIDVGRLLGSKPVQDAIYSHYGDVAYDQIKGAVRDIALGNAPAPDWYRTLDRLRQGVVTASLGWNVFTSALQPFQLANSMARIGPKWVARGVIRWMRDAASMESSVKMIHGKSGFMRTRHMTQVRELNELRNKVGLNTGKTQAWIHDQIAKLRIDPARAQVLTDSYFYFIQKAQQIADVPTWLGAYEKAIDQAHDEDRAIALADQAVIDSQGSGHIKDLAGVERGSWSKIFTTFYSFQNLLLNQSYESLKKTRLDPKSIGRLSVDIGLLLFAPVVVMHALKAGLMGQGDDDDEGLLEALAKEEAAQLANLFVGVREFAGLAEGRDYTGPASMRAVSIGYQLGKQISQGEADEAAFNVATQAAGVYFHFPATQVRRTADGVMALWEGKTKNPAAVLFGPPRE